MSIKTEIMPNLKYRKKCKSKIHTSLNKIQMYSNDANPLSRNNASPKDNSIQEQCLFCFFHIVSNSVCVTFQIQMGTVAAARYVTFSARVELKCIFLVTFFTPKLSGFVTISKV